MNHTVEPADNRFTVLAYVAGLMTLAIILKIFVFHPLATIESVRGELAEHVLSQRELRTKLTSVVAAAHQQSAAPHKRQDEASHHGYYELLNALPAEGLLKFTAITIGGGGLPEKEVPGWRPFEATFECDFQTTMQYFKALKMRSRTVNVVEMELRPVDASTRRMVCTIRGYLSA